MPSHELGLSLRHRTSVSASFEATAADPDVYGQADLIFFDEFPFRVRHEAGMSPQLMRTKTNLSGGRS
jgi:hypothetical protein